MAHPIVRDDLLELEDRLLDDGFGFLLSILPRELFQLYNQRIIINKDLFPLHSGKESPIYAYFRDQKDAQRSVGDLSGPYVELIRIFEQEMAAFARVPPLSWHGTQDSTLVRSPEWNDRTEALIKYFLLVWASNDNYDGILPQPNYRHLVAALGQLTTTSHYQKKQVIHEDEDGTNVHISFRYLNGPRMDEELRPATIDLKDDADGEHGFCTGQKRPRVDHRSNEKPPQEVVDTRLPTPHQSPKPSTPDVDMIDATQDSTRAASVASMDDSALDINLPVTQPLDTDVVMTLATQELIRQSMPTPDTLVEETVVETDPTLKTLQNKFTAEALSHLPKTNTCTFRNIHTSEPGFLGLRLLLGSLQDTPRSELDGAELWASFKMHDKNDRAAPRMHVHAFAADTDEVVGDDLKIKDILPYLRPGPAFHSITPGGDRAEELLLKALVKYFYIIAARERLLGFDKHKMPFNDSFADQLRIAIRRIQTQDPTKKDRHIPKGPKRLKRSFEPTPTAVLSDADDDAQPLTRTHNARRSGRRTGQPSSAAVSESEDNVPGPPPMIPQRLPRRLALGTPIISGMEAPAVNEFLDPDADPADSDGESGDEIPGPISAETSAFLQRRYVYQRQSKQHYETTKMYAKKKEGAIMGIRKVKGMLNKHEYTPEARQRAERDLANRHLVLQAMEKHLAIKEAGVSGWKKRVKELETQMDMAGISPKLVQTWHAVYRKDEY